MQDVIRAGEAESLLIIMIKRYTEVGSVREEKRKSGESAWAGVMNYKLGISPNHPNSSWILKLETTYKLYTGEGTQRNQRATNPKTVNP